MPHPDDQPTGTALLEYFKRYGLGDGGYDEDWAHLKLGVVPVVLPNTDGRKRNLRAHDLHHIATALSEAAAQLAIASLAL